MQHEGAAADASAASVGVHAGVEEVWNTKQLVKAVGLLVASGYSTRGARSLADIESRIRIAEHMTERFLTPVGGLAAWLQKHHSAHFDIRPDGDDHLIGLTPDGAEKFQTRGLQEAPSDAAETMPRGDEQLRDTRAAVFGELAARAAHRSGSGAEG